MGQDQGYGQGQQGWQQQGQPGYQPQLPSWQGQGQQPQYPPPGYYQPQQQPPRRGRTGRILGFGCLGLLALVVIIIVIAAAHGTSSSSSPGALPTLPTVAISQAGASAGSTAAGKQTVTYEVTGSPADVTYGPAGSDSTGTVPMDKTAAIPAKAPTYYAISAQLQGSGTVSCEIKVNGKVISQATANGGYAIASCEIVQDPFSGQWQDTNAA